MAIEMRMPDLATTGSDVTVRRWHVQIGQRIQRGQPLLEIETDKATMDVEAIAGGVVRQLCVQPDEKVATGQLIAVIEGDGAATPSAATGVSSPSSAPLSAAKAQPASAPAARPISGMFAHNRQVRAGTGAAAAAPAALAAITPSLAHRTLARRLQASQALVPQFALQASVNARGMLARRERAAPVKLAWDAFFVYAAAQAMTRFNRLAYRYENDQLVPQGTQAIGVAVDHEGDVFVPAILAAATKSPERISEEIVDQVARLRGGETELRKLQPAVLTITNLGMTRVESFTPFINPPQAAILGVGKVMPTPIACDDGCMAVEPRATLTLAVDHRVVSGRYAADFLDALIAELENL